MKIFKQHCTLRFLALILLSLVLTGCNGLEEPSEREEKEYRQAKNYIQVKNYSKAVKGFKKLIKKRDRAPQSHLELGLIYLNCLNEPVLATYHFEEYLYLEPNSPQAKLVPELIQTAKKEFLNQIPGDWRSSLPTTQMPSLQRETKEASKNRQIKPSSTPSLVQNAPKLSSKQRVYVVETGDTLSKISQKVYKNPHRWQAILDANKSTIANPKNLKIGQELTIPD